MDRECFLQLQVGILGVAQFTAQLAAQFVHMPQGVHGDPQLVVCQQDEPFAPGVGPQQGDAEFRFR